MRKSYTGNYFKIYLWQGVSLALNFLSMFIVVPYLSSNPAVYGIYSVCISVSIFLAYADLGFVGAGQKYAAEHFARGEIDEEIEIIGFTGFILLIVLLIFSLLFLYLSIHPETVIRSLLPGFEVSVASSLLLILSIFTPVTLLQRILQMIFGIRLEDYIIQRTNIIASAVKILSVLWFFRTGNYNIVGYFLFTQIINLLSSVITLIIAIKLYNYNFRLLIAALRYNKSVFFKTKHLALTSLYLTFLWILYYELDPTIIGKFLGAQPVAVYAIGLTVLSFFRSILGILFSPFNARFNHFIGMKNPDGLKGFYLQTMTLTAPLVIIPIVTVSLLAKPLVLSWVGINFIYSVEIVQFIVLCNLFAFITYPTSMLLIAQEKIKELYAVNTIIPIVFWSGVIFTYSYLGLKSFAIFKLIAFVISGIVFYHFSLKFLKLSIIQSGKEIFFPLLLPVLFLIVTTSFINDYMPVEKSKLNLLIAAATAGSLILIAFVIHYFSSERMRIYIYKALNFRTS